MAKGPLVAALVLVLASPASGAPARHPLPDRTAGPVDEPVTKAPVSSSPGTPSIVRHALTAVRLLHLHRGRDAPDPAATARERRTDTP